MRRSSSTIMSKHSQSFRSGFVTIVGRPNVGKSTLLNQLIGQKIAIMSDKPQTTRNKIQAVYTRDDVQIIFIDTPGIHKPKSKLGDFMVQTATDTLNEVDLILFLIDVSEELGAGDRFIMKQFENVSTPVFCVMNKIDLVHPEKLLEIIAQYKEIYDFAEFVPISARQGNNISTLVDLIVRRMPEGPKYYPEDQITDHPEHFIIAELIREKLLHATFEEVPHSLAVQVEQMYERDNGVVYIGAVIFVERDSQKGIIIGKQGSMLKEIGRLARKDIESLLGSRIFLELWVKVKKDWRNQDRVLRDLGFRKE